MVPRRPRRIRRQKATREGTRRFQMLDMGRAEEFKWDLAQILKPHPDQRVAEPLRAAIYSKASKIGIQEARRYVDQKEGEGIIDKGMAKQIILLLQKYTRRR